MRLEEVQGKSKKTGKEYTGYRVCIGKYKTPLFFPSEVELIYIKSIIAKDNRKAFQNEFDDEITDLDEED